MSKILFIPLICNLFPHKLDSNKFQERFFSFLFYMSHNVSLSLSLFTITLAFELGLRIQTSSFPRRQNCSVGAQVDGFWLK